MSFDALSWAMKQKAPSTGAFAVLCVLANHAGEDDGICWPSQARLAEVTRMSRRSVIKHLNALCQANLVEKIDHHGRVRYRLLCIQNNTSRSEKIAPSYAEFSHGYEKPAQECEKFSHPSEPITEPVKKPINNPALLTPNKTSMDFEAIWNAYPGRGKDGATGPAFKGQKKTALIKFETIYRNTKEADREALIRNILAACADYAAFIQRANYPSKHLSTWLNAAGWETDYSTGSGPTAGPPRPGSKADRARAIFLGDDDAVIEGRS